MAGDCFGSGFLCLFGGRGLLNLASDESHGRFCLFFGGTEIDEGGGGAGRAVGVEDLSIDIGYIAHLPADHGTDGDGAVGGGDGVVVFEFHLGGYAGGLEFAGDDPSGNFVDEEGLYAAVEGVDPALVVGGGGPMGEDIVAVFEEAEMKTDGIVGGAADAVVALALQPGVFDTFEHSGEFLALDFFELCV